MKYFFTIIVLCCIHILSAQTIGLSARIEWVYVDGEDKGEYTGGIKINSGSIKINETITAHDDANYTFQLKVISLEDMQTHAAVKELKAGKDGFVVLKTLDGKKLNKLKGGFTLGTNVANAVVSSNQTTANKAVLQCKFNGTDWQGKSFYSSASFYPNGNALAKTKSPYFILAFQAVSAPDNRQLTFQSTDFTAGKGSKPYEKLDVLLSGNITGLPEKDCIQTNTQIKLSGTIHKPFQFEITQWEVKGTDIIISGQFSGQLNSANPFKKLLKDNCEDVMITDGVFKNVKVKLYNESYATQEKQLGEFWNQKGQQIEKEVDQMLDNEVKKAKQQQAK